MSMIIAHNISAMNTQRQFGTSARGMSTSMERLSSGFKINTGKDDPAGLLISEKLRSQMNGIERAKQNTEEAMNVMGIAEGALSEMNDILKKMKSLATHSANNGVTTSDQIAADQSELDSAVQTMDRIAQTTEFAGEKLLNGAKEISFEASTAVKGTQQNALLNVRESTFDQIFKRDGYSVSLSFTGAAGKVEKLTDNGERVDFSKQATKAYMEIDTAVSCSSITGSNNPKAQVIGGKFTQEQTFTLTGSKGSRQFTFGVNQSISALVSGIHNSAGSTGVDAALIFNSAQTIDKLDNPVSSGSTNGTDSRVPGSAAVFGSDRYSVDDACAINTALMQANPGQTLQQLKDAGEPVVAAGEVRNGVTEVTNLDGVQWGKNTDGQGNIYIKYVSDTEIELYKDSSMSPESLVASGHRNTTTGVTNFIETNNSGLSGRMTVASNPADKDASLADLKNNYINTGGLSGTNGIAWSGNICTTNQNKTTMFNASKSVVTGVELGTNTDPDGKIYFKVINDGNNVQVFAYKNEKMQAKDLVAKSDKMNLDNSMTITLDSVKNSDGTASTGLGIVLSADELATAEGKGTTTGYLQFENLGARIFATEYGSENFVKITQDKGGIFTSFDSPGDDTRTLLDSGDRGTTKLIYGQDATVGVNGKEVKTNGLDLNMATQDIQARFTFNAGKVGSTTLAQVGYGEGSVFTKAGALNIGENKEIEDYKRNAAGNLMYYAPQTEPDPITGDPVPVLDDEGKPVYVEAPTTFATVAELKDAIAEEADDDIRDMLQGMLTNLIGGSNNGLSAFLCNAGHNTQERIGEFQNGMQLQLGEGAGDQNRTVVSLKSMTTENLGRIVRGGYWDTSNPSVWTDKTFTLKDIQGGGAASLREDPTLTMAIIDQAIDDVAGQRAMIGAMQSNLLQTNANNLDVSLENITKTESGIRDADMATEMSEFTKNQVLQSAAMSMMSQANQASQNVLQLLR